MQTDQSGSCQSSQDYAALRRRIKGLLLKLNFRNKLVGTHYLEEALLLKMLCQRQYVKVMQVYEAIAHYHHTKSSNVERAIRNTIADCHRNKSLQNVNDLLGCNLCATTYPPTNSDFITEVTIRLLYLSDEIHEADHEFGEKAKEFAKSAVNTNNSDDATTATHGRIQ